MKFLAMFFLLSLTQYHLPPPPSPIQDMTIYEFGSRPIPKTVMTRPFVGAQRNIFSPNL
jgi:hypothetical protein